MEIFEGDKKQCYGCKACVQICPKDAIVVRRDEEGFDYPFIDSDRCVACNLCRKVCPVNFTVNLERTDSPVVYAGWILDKCIQAKSSSGGLFSVFALETIRQNGVVFGAEWGPGLTVSHACVEKATDLFRLRGSKYIQSDINTSYVQTREYLKAGRSVLFTGTPCQIAGLYGFLGKEHDKLVTCEVICHGVPSQLAFDKYRQKIAGLCDADVTGFSFRDTTIWNYRTCYIRDGKERCLFGKNDFFMKSFFSLYTFRESCYQCRFARLPRVADITIGDFWGIGSRVPFKKKLRGVSLILVNSAQGEAWVEQCKETVFLEKRQMQEAVEQNGNLVRPSSRPVERNDFYKDLDLSLDELSVKYRLETSWRNRLGFFKRKLMRMYVSVCK